MVSLTALEFENLLQEKNTNVTFSSLKTIFMPLLPSSLGEILLSAAVNAK